MIITQDLVILLISFSTAIVFLAMFIVFIFLKTPALVYLMASLKRKIVLLNPKEDKYLWFKIAENEGGIAKIKKGNSFLINPQDTFTESKSKVPTVIVYGNMGMTINPKEIHITEYLRKNGIINFEYLSKLNERMKEEFEEQYDLTEKRIAELNKLLKKQTDLKGIQNLEKEKKALQDALPILNERRINPLGDMVVDGESVNLNNTLSYLNVSKNQGDLIEAGIQRGTAVKLRKISGSDIVKWGIIFAIILIGAALAYVIITNTTGGGGGAGIDYNKLANAITGAKVVASNVTGTSIS